MYNLTKQ